ncbi:hypothetical protein WM03_24720 [Burkholderia ubonensis]|uniref:hypothetical protein n=1 Tax=Burkholderia ubonensis TaxID=101571 RepID=UPI000757D990|nr:hypothetical protein [Burkholderia ubonensis]KVN59744.1 hypothetical protein WJ65_02855 [Burkholderia ubonensis]KWI05195.1 hypothetical protein WM02_27640 [Burkholderia ubonensis]KWI22862.1 hypothetical protein WM03_24720 [Burkholderia ubonensis]ODQ40787.1 hypothetical protein BGV63_09285 [Burkholderia ubonensis]OJA31176.1 hypothetical protein BGV58_09260 [Burkholderia ubonensis]
MQKNQTNGQLCLFSDDRRVCFSFDHDATAVWQGGAAIFVVAGTQYRLKPIPKMPELALVRVMEMMVRLHHERDSWRPTLQKAGDVIEHTLKDGTQCVVALWEEVQNPFVGVQSTKGILHFRFPPPEQWANIGLDWLLAERCGCGRFDCDPAPFRRLPCPDAAW